LRRMHTNRYGGLVAVTYERVVVAVTLILSLLLLSWLGRPNNSRGKSCLPD